MNELPAESISLNGSSAPHHAHHPHHPGLGGPQPGHSNPAQNSSGEQTSAAAAYPAAGKALLPVAEPQAGAGPVPGRPAPAPATLWRRLNLGRQLRRLLALVLVGVALWWFVLPLLFPVTGQAVVNARLVQVRAPIDGIAAKLCRDLGETVSAGQPLLCLENQQIDTVHLSTLTTRRAEILARRDRLTQELAEVESAEVACRRTARRYQQSRVALLDATLTELTAQTDAARSQYVSTEKQLRRVNVLAQKRSASSSDQEVAAANEVVARKRIEQGEAALFKIRKEREAAAEGIFLQVETPYFLQRAEDLALQVPQLRAKLQEAESLLAVLDSELLGEQQRMQSLSRATVSSPVAGVVWNCQGNLGQVVKKNETVFEVADSGSIFVEALLHQTHLTSVVPGSRATVLLTGGEAVNGRVRALRTSGPSDVESFFALKLASGDLKQVRVLIDIEPGAARADMIGRHARVLITSDQSGPLQRGMRWLFSRMGG